LITSIRKIACVGSGLVGQGWATLLALAGYPVTLEDVTEEKVREANKRVEKQMRFLEEKGLAKNSEEALQRVSVTTNLAEALEGADYIQESVYESYPAKKEIYQRMDEATGPNVILASSTYGLMMSEIQKSAKIHPERCIVAHPCARAR
jgi:carnitine 3-dehydrogenase